MEKGKTRNTYLIGSDTETSNINIVNKILKIFSKKENYKFDELIKYVKDRKGHDFRYAINYQKIRKKLKFKNQTGFQQVLEKTVEFYVKNQNKLDIIFSNKF